MPQLPNVPGVTFRPFLGASDYPHFARIITTCSRGEGSDRVETAEQIASGYDHLERCDPRHDLLVAEVDGVPVGYSRVWWDQEVDGPLLYKHVCFIDPIAGGRGIGSSLFAWNEGRLLEIASAHDVPDKLFEVWANDRNAAAAALARDNGLEPVTYAAEMVRPSVEDLPEHALPDGLEIRPVREEDLRTIWEAEVEAFRDHWATSSRARRRTSGSMLSRTSTRRCGRSPGTTKASPVRSSRSSTQRRTRSTVAGAGGPRTSQQHAAGGGVDSRRR